MQAEDEYVDRFPRSDLRCAAAALVLVYVRTLPAYVVLVPRVLMRIIDRVCYVRVCLLMLYD